MNFDEGDLVWVDSYLDGEEWRDRRRPGVVLLVYERHVHDGSGGHKKKKATYVKFLDKCGIKESADAKCSEMNALEALALSTSE